MNKEMTDAKEKELTPPQGVERTAARNLLK
jgi:hypothetical protein